MLQSAPSPAIRVGVDTFAFPNESRSKNAGQPDLYANYCFVMTRAVVQFHCFARFDPAAPKLGPEAYTTRRSTTNQRGAIRLAARPPRLRVGDVLWSA